jgi:hypothetical protein
VAKGGRKKVKETGNGTTLNISNKIKEAAPHEVRAILRLDAVGRQVREENTGDRIKMNTNIVFEDQFVLMEIYNLQFHS